jgi:homoserine O-acetyltransferase/O-succinyltransferase
MVATGAWLETHDPGERKFIKIGFLLLENGETLPDVTIAYQTWGQLNAAKDNAILVNHAMTGWSDVPGWWPSMVGPGLPFDTNKYFVVCPNVIGGCQGSTGPSSIAPDGKRWGSRFPTVTIRDMVNAEVAFTDAMGIHKYKLAVGPSLGGMRALEWAVQLPDRVGAICTIGSSAVATGDQIGTASIQIRAIKSDPHFNKGDDTGRYAVESYLDHQASKLAQRFDANTYIALTEAMNSHDIGRNRGGVAAALATIKVPVVAVSIDTDRLFPVRLQAEIAELAPAAAPLVTISSPFGHDGFLVEVESVGNVIREALNLAK